MLSNLPLPMRLKNGQTNKLMSIFIFILSLVVIIAGFALTLLPVFPGIILVWGGAFLYAILTHFEKINWIYLLIFGCLVILSFVFDWLSGIIGAKRYGASRAGIWGGILGVFIGIPLGPMGMIFTPIATTVLAEYLFDKNLRRSLKSGYGNFVGYLFGVFGKLILALIIIIIFLIKVL